MRNCECSACATAAATVTWIMALTESAITLHRSRQDQIRLNLIRSSLKDVPDVHILVYDDGVGSKSSTATSILRHHGIV